MAELTEYEDPEYTMQIRFVKIGELTFDVPGGRPWEEIEADARRMLEEEVGASEAVEWQIDSILGRYEPQSRDT